MREVRSEEFPLFYGEDLIPLSYQFTKCEHCGKPAIETLYLNHTRQRQELETVGRSCLDKCIRIIDIVLTSSKN